MQATFTPTGGTPLPAGDPGIAAAEAVAGGTWTSDNGTATVDTTGELVSISPALGKMASWTQTQVFIGAVVGIGLGALAVKFLGKKRRK